MVPILHQKSARYVLEHLQRKLSPALGPADAAETLKMCPETATIIPQSQHAIMHEVPGSENVQKLENSGTISTQRTAMRSCHQAVLYSRLHCTARTRKIHTARALTCLNGGLNGSRVSPEVTLTSPAPVGEDARRACAGAEDGRIVPPGPRPT